MARGGATYVLARMSSIFALVRWGEMYGVVSEGAVACPKNLSRSEFADR